MTKIILSALGGAIFAAAGLAVWFVWYFKDVWK